MGDGLHCAFHDRGVAAICRLILGGMAFIVCCDSAQHCFVSLVLTGHRDLVFDKNAGTVQERYRWLGFRGRKGL